jgi:hypothetical protein
MFLTRMGFGSKVVVTGDITQIDLPRGKRSGLIEARKVLKGVDDIGFCYLKEVDVVRHQLVKKVINRKSLMSEGIENKLMTADKRYEIRGKIKHVKKVPQGVERSNLHLVIKYPVQSDIHKHKEVRQHGDEITEAHPFDLMAFIFVIIVLKLLERLFICLIEVYDISHGLDQECCKSDYAYEPEVVHISRFIGFKKQNGNKGGNEESWKKQTVRLMSLSLQKGNHRI